jgi:hypothetical protein
MRKVLIVIVIGFAGNLGMVAQSEAQTFGLRGGLLLSGDGDFKIECDGDCGDTSDEESVDDVSGLLLAGDVLFPAGKNIDVGFGLMYVTKTELEERDEFELGSDLSAVGIGQLRVPLQPKMAFAGRALGGLLVLFPGGELEDSIDAMKDVCDEAPASATCDLDEGPYLGFTLGASGGIRYHTGQVVLTADLLLQYINIFNMLDTEVAEGGQSIETWIDYAGTRFWLVAGVEFGS